MRDQGIGIDEADRRHLFERFVRGHGEAVQSVPGTGLGLSLVKEVVTAHGGEISVESQPGQGSTFTIRIGQQRMTRILVVEDERAIAVGLRDNLEVEGYEVELVQDGLTARTRARDGEFDLILLDIMLPGKDGLSVCRSLRAAGLRTPIIILTAKGQEADKVTGLEVGADDYITKPFGQRELLRAREGGAAPVARDGLSTRRDVRVGRSSESTSAGTRRARRRAGRADRDRVQAAARAGRTRGEVVTFDRLVELVWGKDHALSDRVVYTHVNNLRAKIPETLDGRSRISNVRGFGYRFEG